MRTVLGHLRANAVAYAALFIALGGAGAWAAEKIGSNDLAKNAVRSKHLKDGQVKTRDADLVKYRKDESAVVTGNTTPLNEGPAITGRAEPGELLTIHARVDIQRDAGSAGCGVFLGVQGAGSGESGVNILTSSSSTPETRWMDLDQLGTTAKHDAVARTVPVADGGPYRISFSFYSGNATTDCTFTDRNLWVEQAR
jgi:hypothetical protein